MRNISFTLTASLFQPTPPFTHAQLMRPPWLWIVRDRTGSEVADAKTRAGARRAVLALYAGASQSERRAA